MPDKQATSLADHSARGSLVYRVFGLQRGPLRRRPYLFSFAPRTIIARDRMRGAPSPVFLAGGRNLPQPDMPASLWMEIGSAPRIAPNESIRSECRSSRDKARSHGLWRS